MHLLAVGLSIAFLLAAEEADESKQGNLSFSQLNLYKVVLYLAMTHSGTQTRAQNIQTNAPHFARHEECADKIADFANCIASLDTGHRAPVK